MCDSSIRAEVLGLEHGAAEFGHRGLQLIQQHCIEVSVGLETCAEDRKQTDASAKRTTLGEATPQQDCGLTAEHANWMFML